MRILFFSTAFPQPYEPSRNPDNLERCVALSRQHPVRVMSPYSWLHLRSAIESHDHLSSRGLLVDRPVFFYPPGVFRGAHAWCMWQGIRAAAARLVRTFQPDAVLSYWTYPDTAVATAVARLARIPCVAIVGGSDVLAIDPEAPGAAGRRARRVLEAVDGIAAVSDSIKHRIVALGISPSKIGVLGAAVDKAVFVPGSRQDARQQLDIAGTAEVLVWVGRMVAVKALDVLLDVVARLKTSRPNLRLYLIGDGPLRRSLESRVAAAGLATHVVFVGRVPHRDLAAYYRAADLTVLPSEWEGMPNTLLESHACGTAFVATAVGAVPQLAIPDVDELVRPGDQEQLAAAITRALTRPRDARVSASKVGGWDEMADQLADLLEWARNSRRITGAPAAVSLREKVRMRPRPSSRHSWHAR